MKTVATKQGIQLTPVTGINDFFMVEYSDGSAELFDTWDAAMTAGNFEGGADAAIA